MRNEEMYSHEPLQDGTPDRKPQFDSDVRNKLAPLRAKLPSGWKLSLTMGASLSLAVLLLNLSVTIWSTTKERFGDSFHEEDPNKENYDSEPMEIETSDLRVLHSGSCNTNSILNTAIHLCINIFSSILLAASNYCMQCLIAPTRGDIQTFHSRGRWLDIGVPSIHNVAKIPKKRGILWCLLAISSVPLHILSAKYKEFALEGEGFRLAEVWELGRAGKLEKLSNVDCMSAYATAFQAKRSDVLLLTEPGPYPELQDIPVSQSSSTLSRGGDWCVVEIYEWICSPNMDTCTKSCRSMLPDMKKNANEWSPFGGLRVKYCLSRREPEECQLHFNTTIMAFVIVANAIKVCVMLYTAFFPPREIILVLGDAIESFLTSPDEFTARSCLVSAKDVKRSRKHWHGPRRWSSVRQRWASAVSRRRWIASVSL
ncbi:hypothetical protein AUP68_00169 [Ilyonectria robusta]